MGDMGEVFKVMKASNDGHTSHIRFQGNDL